MCLSTCLLDANRIERLYRNPRSIAVCTPCVACNPLYRWMKTACAESSWQTFGWWRALRRGKTKMAQIVASTNERPQSAKKYEQRYLFPPCNPRDTRAQCADHLPKLARPSFNRNRVHIVPHCRTNYK